MPDTDQDQIGEQETAKRRDEALKRALGMPHKPHKPKSKPEKQTKKK